MFFIWVIIGGLIQSVSFWHINFLVLFTIFAGLRKGPVSGLLIGSLVGFFAEILSFSAFGLNIALYSLLGLLSGVVKSSIFYKESIFMDFIFSFFGILFFYSAYFIFTKTIHTSIFFTALFSAIVSPLLFRVID